MSRFDYWIDADSRPHKIRDMETDYIVNCLKNLRKWQKDWGDISPGELTPAELQRQNDVGMKSWFVLNGADYIAAFLRELEQRKEA